MKEKCCQICSCGPHCKDVGCTCECGCECCASTEDFCESCC